MIRIVIYPFRRKDPLKNIFRYFDAKLWFTNEQRTSKFETHISWKIPIFSSFFGSLKSNKKTFVTHKKNA